MNLPQFCTGQDCDGIGAPRRTQYLGVALFWVFCIVALISAEEAEEAEKPVLEPHEEFSGASERTLDAKCGADEESSFAAQDLFDFVALETGYGDVQTCPTDTDHFTLTIQYNAFSDVDWSLRNQDARTQS